MIEKGGKYIITFRRHGKRGYSIYIYVGLCSIFSDSEQKMTDKGRTPLRNGLACQELWAKILV